jgi:hypothetical protein
MVLDIHRERRARDGVLLLGAGVMDQRLQPALTSFARAGEELQLASYGTGLLDHHPTDGRAREE